ncbi:hypothetical protein I3F58_02805 [Streptomyces sp. MUM 203J]|uniref:hypothetical protein n=1 Tax=Streptomyces sp. MUM 203J TaxID=2791990 RepID=UPI001F04B94F|nr:hypothetical protein [Streptomyces sp. MUM 203J]MCH0538505.1 hypothetical protein [Streptomyces sp. MUM 203J]
MSTEQQRPEWRDVLERCGLHVLESTSQDGPPVRSAIYAVTGFEVEPVASIPTSSPGAIAELDEKWHFHASRVSLYDDNGEFLVLPPVSGGSEIGWVRVRDTIGRNLPSRIAGVTGSPEFLAVSINGSHLCAASVEEYDYWVVLHEFS